MVWEKDTMKPADNYEVIRETTNNNSSYKLMSYTTTGSEYTLGIITAKLIQ